MKILLAEDEPVMAMAIVTRLKNDGYEVVYAADGSEALKELGKQKPDMLITDILMPFTSGLELIGIIRSEAAYKNLPIIVLSALGQEATVLEAFNLGADDFLTKPLNPSELSLRVKRLLYTEYVG